jgi:hypothetical protein
MAAILSCNTKSTRKVKGPGMVAHAFNPQHSGGRGRRISEFEASLGYKVSTRTARDLNRETLSRKNKITTTKNQQQQQQKLSAANTNHIPARA